MTNVQTPSTRDQLESMNDQQLHQLASAFGIVVSIPYRRRLLLASLLEHAEAPVRRSQR
jgi:hypothetical protein